MRGLLLILVALTPLLTAGWAAPARAQLATEGAWAGLLRFAVRQLNVPGEFEIELGAIESRDGGETFIAALSIRDDQGVWLSAEDLSVVWDSNAALTGGARFPRIAARTLTLARLPVTRGDPPSAEDPEAGLELAWPRAPVSLSIDALDIAEARLGAPVLGEPVAARISGAVFDQGNEQRLRLSVERVDDGPAFRFATQTDFNFAEDAYALSLETEEAPGGLVAKAIGAPADAPLSLTLSATGGSKSLPFTLRADAPGALSASVDGQAAWAPRVSLKLNAAARPGPAAADWLRAAAGDAARIALDLSQDDAGVWRLSQARLDAPALALIASGDVDPENDAVRLSAALSSPDPAAFAALTGLERLGALQGRFSADGELSAPLATFRTALEDVAGSFGAADRFALTVEARPENDDALIDLSLGAEGLALTDPKLARVVGAAPALTAAGRWEGARSLARLSRFAVTAAALSAEGAGALDLDDAPSLDLRLAATVPDAAPILALGDIEGAGRARLAINLSKARAEGVEQAEISADFAELAFADPEIARFVGDQATLTLRLGDVPDPAAPGAQRIEISEGRFAAAAVEADAEGWLAPTRDALDLALALRSRDPKRLGELIGGDLAGADATARVSGALSAPDIRLDAALTEPKLADNAAAALRARADVTLSRDERWPFSLALSADQTRIDDPGLARLVGAAPRLDAKGVFDAATATVLLERAALAAAKADAEIDGTLRLAALGAAPPSIDARLSANLADLSAVAPVGGSAALKGTVAGPLADPGAEAELTIPNLAGLGVDLRRIEANLAAERLVSAPKAALDLSASLAGAPAAARVAAERRGDRFEITLERLRHRGASGAGRVSAPAAGGPASGALALRVPDLTPFAPLIGPASGALDLNLNLKPQRGEQGLDLRLDGRDLALGPKRRAKTVALRAAGTPARLDLDLAADGLRFEGLRDAQLRAEAALQSRGAATTLSLSQLSLKNATQDLSLAAPATVSLAPRLGVDALALRLNDGRATLSGDERAFEARLDDLPLDILAALDLAPVAAGRLSGQASFSRQGRGAAQARLQLQGLGLGPAGRRFAAAEKLDGQLELDWDGRRADLRAQIAPPETAPVRLDVSVPVTGPTPTVRPSAPLSGALKWSGEAERLFALAPVEDVALSGRAEIDLTLSGAVSDPKLAGFAKLSDGRLQVVETGTDLRALFVTVEPSPAGPVALSLTAKDAPAPDAGTLSAKGSVDPAAAGASIDVAIDKAALIRRDDAFVRASGTTEIRLGRADQRIAGRITIDEGELRLIGGGVVEPPLIEHSVVGADEPDPAPAAPANPIALNLAISAPQQLFVRGRGLQSEWGADLKIQGTADAPRIVGDVVSRRGRFALAGADFRLAESRVAFTGPAEPNLDVTLNRQTAAISGDIAVTGPATDPTITLSSSPALPEDEILPQLIFGRSLAQLTAIEAAQLASGIAALTSGKPGALDAAREAIGVDTLRVEQGESGSATVGAGRYVAPGVYVEAREGVDPKDRSVAVEVEITPQVRVEGEAGAAGDVGVGVEWRKDY